MKKIIVFIILISFPLTLSAHDNWTKTDTTFQTLSIALHCADLKQTHNIISRRNEGYCEANRILGKYPSHGEVNIYFALMTTAQLYVAYKLPQPYRRIWQLFQITMSSRTVSHNFKAGLHIKF